MFPLISLAQPISAVVTADPKHAVGDRIVYGNAQFVYSYNDDTTELPIGSNLVITSANTGFSMVLSGATSERYVGMVEHTTVPTGGYFWMLVGGIAENATCSGAAANGAWLYAQAGGGLGSTAATGYSTAGIQNGAGAKAKALEAAANSTSVGGLKVWYVCEV